MEGYRVVVKEVRKTTNACDACKRRKGKCSGTIPCTHCKDCGIECSYLQGNKKRGPTKKKRKAVELEKGSSEEGDASPDRRLALSPLSGASSPSSYEHALSATFEKCSLVDLYLDTMAQGTQSSNRQKLLNPTTLSQKMRTSAVMAFVSRGIGQSARADQCSADARVLAGQIIEDKSYDAAEAFIALSGYFPLHDHRNLMYLGIAHNIAKSLATKTIDVQRLYNFSLVGSTVLDLSMDTPTKRRVLKLHGPSLLAQIQEPSPMDILLTAMTKFYCNLNPRLVDALSIEKLTTLSDVRLTKEEADVIMADIVIMEYLAGQQSNGKTLRFLIKLAKVLTLWLSGNTDRAIKEADATIEWDSFDAIHYLSAATLLIEVPQAFWAYVLLYVYHGQIEKAEKVYNMFVSVAKLYGQEDMIKSLPTPAVLVATMAAAAANPNVNLNAAGAIGGTGAIIGAAAALSTALSPIVKTELSTSSADSSTTITLPNDPFNPNITNSHSTIINIPFISTSPTTTTSPPSPSSPPSPMANDHALYNTTDAYTTQQLQQHILVNQQQQLLLQQQLQLQRELQLSTEGDDDDILHTPSFVVEDMNSIYSTPTPTVVVTGAKGEEEYSFLEELLMH